MNISNAQLSELFNKIPDANLKRQLENIVSGRIVKQVYCNSKTCKGRHIANIMDNGQIHALTENGKMYMRSSRHRLDGFMGFECWCGNDSRLAEQEKGEISAGAPDKATLERVWEKVTGNPSKYRAVKGEQLIDGFTIKEII